MERRAIYEASQVNESRAPYALHANHISIHPDWKEYLSTNSGILKAFCYWELCLFLQVRNPNVPDIANNLSSRRCETAFQHSGKITSGGFFATHAEMLCGNLFKKILLPQILWQFLKFRIFATKLNGVVMEYLGARFYNLNSGVVFWGNDK